MGLPQGIHQVRSTLCRNQELIVKIFKIKYYIRYDEDIEAETKEEAIEIFSELVSSRDFEYTKECLYINDKLEKED